MESLFRCPVCGAPLDRGDRAYRCPAGHSYDIAREGYTYLLPPNQKHSADPGDDRDMAAASVTLWLGLYSAFASAFSPSLRLLRPAVL